MDHDVVIVGIHLANVVDHRLLLVGRLRVLLAQVPVQGQVVAEAGDQLAAIELSFRPEIAAVQRLGNVAAPVLVPSVCRRSRSPAS